MSNLRQIRKARDLTQAALGDMIGVTEASVSRYESDPNKLTLPLMQKLAGALRCRVSDITGETTFGIDVPGAGRGINFRSRQAIKDELRQVDGLTIRLLREYVSAQPDAPPRLRQLEDYAIALREELAAAV